MARKSALNSQHLSPTVKEVLLELAQKRGKPAEDVLKDALVLALYIQREIDEGAVFLVQRGDSLTKALFHGTSGPQN